MNKNTADSTFENVEAFLLAKAHLLASRNLTLSSMKTTTIRVTENILERLDSLAENLSRPRSWVINQAIERSIEYEERFVG